MNHDYLVIIDYNVIQQALKKYIYITTKSCFIRSSNKSTRVRIHKVRLPKKAERIVNLNFEYGGRTDIVDEDICLTALSQQRWRNKNDRCTFEDVSKEALGKSLRD